VGLNSFQTSGSSPTPRVEVVLLGSGATSSAIARRLTGPDSLSILHLAHICDLGRAREAHAWRLAGISDNREVV
jgi:hypothetical protein